MNTALRVLTAGTLPLSATLAKAEIDWSQVDAATGDFVATARELEPLIKTLQSHGIEVTACVVPVATQKCDPLCPPRFLAKPEARETNQTTPLRGNHKILKMLNNMRANHFW